MIEVEYYRRVAERTVGRTIREVVAPDDWFLKGTTAAALGAALVGRVVSGTRRIGKLLLLDTDGPTLGLRFGMTGRLVVDGVGPIEKLEYSSGRDDPAWMRFALRFADGGELRLVDPRRLGGVVLDPGVDHLGTDALSVTPARLRDALRASRAPLKAWLLDQGRVAGLGNLLVDEILWRAGLDPTRAAGGLDDDELTTLHRTMREVLADLMARGGSHTGDVRQAAALDGLCPRDGAALVRRQVGGRTTVSCPVHQR